MTKNTSDGRILHCTAANEDFCKSKGNGTLCHSVFRANLTILFVAPTCRVLTQTTGTGGVEDMVHVDIPLTSLWTSVDVRDPFSLFQSYGVGVFL